MSKDLRPGNPGFAANATFGFEVSFPFRIISPEQCRPEEKAVDASAFAEPADASVDYLHKLVCADLIPSGDANGTGNWARRQEKLLPLVHRLEALIPDAPVGPVREVLMIKTQRFYHWAKTTLGDELARQASEDLSLASFLDDPHFPMSVRKLLETVARDLGNRAAKNDEIAGLLGSLAEQDAVFKNPDLTVYVQGIKDALNEPDLVDAARVQSVIELTRQQALKFRASAAELTREKEEYASKG